MYQNRSDANLLLQGKSIFEEGGDHALQACFYITLSLVNYMNEMADRVASISDEETEDPEDSHPEDKEICLRTALSRVWEGVPGS